MYLWIHIYVLCVRERQREREKAPLITRPIALLLFNYTAQWPFFLTRPTWPCSWRSSWLENHDHRDLWCVHLMCTSRVRDTASHCNTLQHAATLFIGTSAVCIKSSWIANCDLQDFSSDMLIAREWRVATIGTSDVHLTSHVYMKGPRIANWDHQGFVNCYLRLSRVLFWCTHRPWIANCDHRDFWRSFSPIELDVTTQKMANSDW